PDLDVAVAKVTSDRDGNFSFPDVDAGKWWVGVAPYDPQGDSNSRPAVDWLARYVEIPPGVTEQLVDIRGHRGLFVRGRVVDPHGNDVDDCFVHLLSEDAEGSINCDTYDGRFTFGPLAPGRFTVKASSTEEFAGS